jgi:sRNA-binding protein
MEKKKRIMEHISDPNQKKHILTNYLFGKEMSVKLPGSNSTAHIVMVNEDSVILKLSTGWISKKFRNLNCPPYCKICRS